VNEITYSVSMVSKAIGKHPNTVRLWTGRYADHLSEQANVADGKERKYTTDDVAVLATVAQLSAQGQKHDDIMLQIAAGDRITPESMPEPQKSAPEAETSALATVDLLDRFIVRYEEKIDELQGKLDTESEARRQAEVDRARLIGQLNAVYRRHWWQVWKPERPPED